MPIIQGLPWQEKQLLPVTDNASLVLGGHLSGSQINFLEGRVLGAVWTNEALSRELSYLAIYTTSAPTLRLPGGGLMDVAVEANTNTRKDRTEYEDSLAALTLLQRHVPILRLFKQVAVDLARPNLSKEHPNYDCGAYAIKA